MCDVRGVWLVEPSTREVVFSRRFRTVERRARSLAAAAAAAAAARPSKGITTTTSATEPASSDSNAPPQPLPAAAAWRDLPPTDAEWIEAVLAELAGGGDTDADPVSNQSSKQAQTHALHCRQPFGAAGTPFYVTCSCQQQWRALARFRREWPRTWEASLTASHIDTKSCP
jgi:hypothetical protein